MEKAAQNYMPNSAKDTTKARTIAEEEEILHHSSHVMLIR